jgi:hypothetical protein
MRAILLFIHDPQIASAVAFARPGSVYTLDTGIDTVMGTAKLYGTLKGVSREYRPFRWSEAGGPEGGAILFGSIAGE